MVSRSELEKFLVENSKLLMHVAFTITNNQHDAEDAVGNAVLRAFTCIESLRNDSKLKAWVCAIVDNEAKQILRERKKLYIYTNEELDSYIGMGPLSPDDSYLLEQVLKLEEKYRKVTVLHFICGYNIKELTEILDLSDKTIRKQIEHSRKLIRKICEEGGIEYE